MFPLLLILLAVCVPGSSSAETDPRCSRIDKRQRYGPFDYRNQKDKLGVVEKYHFTVEQRRSAMRGNNINTWAELDYTLRAFPNHAPALFLLNVYEKTLAERNSQMYKLLQGRPTYAPVGCYFDRARRFAPDDPNVLNVIGRTLTAGKQHKKAIEAFKTAVKLAARSASAHYNLALAYYAAGDYANAAKSAREAYRLGYKRTELRERLKRKGHW